MAYNFYDYMIGEIEEHKEQEENITLKQIIKISALLVEIEEIEETILYIEEKINKLQETKEDVKDYIQKIEDLQELKEFAKNKIQEIKDLHPIWEYIYNQNKEKLHKNEPFKITINNQTYTHIKNTETFYLSESSQKITVLNLMKRTLPNVTKSLYKRIIPPDEIYDFSNSTRLKIIKAAQLNYCEPPINEDTRQFTPLFKHLSENV